MASSTGGAVIIPLVPSTSLQEIPLQNLPAPFIVVVRAYLSQIS